MIDEMIHGRPGKSLFIGADFADPSLCWWEGSIYWPSKNAWVGARHYGDGRVEEFERPDLSYVLPIPMSEY